MTGDSEALSALAARTAAVFASEAGRITIGCARFPLIEVSFDGGVDDATFRRYLDGFAALIESGSPYAMLIDLTYAGPPDARQRNMQADMLREHEPTILRNCRGVAYLVTSSIVRASLTVVMWLQRLSYDYVIVGSRDEAEAWLAGRVPRA